MTKNETNTTIICTDVSQNVACLDNIGVLCGLAIFLEIFYVVLLVLTLRNFCSISKRQHVGKRMKIAQVQMVAIEVGRMIFFIQFIAYLAFPSGIVTEKEQNIQEFSKIGYLLSNSAWITMAIN